MTLPNFQQLMLPLLSRAAKLPGETSLRELEEAIALDLGLSSDDRRRLLPSGQQTVFHNRLNWAKSYMAKAGLLETTRRGYFAATPDARALVTENLGEIDNSVLSRFPAFLAWKAQQRSRAPHYHLTASTRALPSSSSLSISLGGNRLKETQRKSSVLGGKVER